MESNTNFDEIRAILKEITEKQNRLTERQAEIAEERRKERNETSREISRVSKIVGDIGNKFGSFTEGMAFPSMERVLRKQFGITDVAMRYKAQRADETMEIDVLGLANGNTSTAVMVEVKSHLKERDVEQILRNLNRFTGFFPEHKGKKLYGLLAYVDGPEEIRQQAVRAGLYTARIHDEVFTLLPEKGFRPRDFSASPATA